MLFYETVEPGTRSILERLQSLPELNNLRLVGGTALSLYYGHRKSIDLDLFGGPIDKEVLIDVLSSEFDDFELVESPAKWALFLYLSGVKVDIVSYEYKWLEGTLEEDGLILARKGDLAAMKVNAIMRRGTKKDFWDINEILNHFSLDQIINWYNHKYPQQRQLISVPQALLYFDDAEDSPDPICLKELSWAKVKKSIQRKVSDFLS